MKLLHLKNYPEVSNSELFKWNDWRVDDIAKSRGFQWGDVWALSQAQNGERSLFVHAFFHSCENVSGPTS